MSERTKNLTTCALMAALMAVCSQIAIPLPGGVPLTLSLVGVYLTGIFWSRDGPWPASVSI